MYLKTIFDISFHISHSLSLKNTSLVLELELNCSRQVWNAQCLKYAEYLTCYYTVFSHFFFLYSMRFSIFFDFIFLAHSHKRIRLHAQLQHAFGRLFSCCHNFGFAAAAAVKSIPCLGCCIVYLSATVHFRCLSAAYGNAKQVPDSIMCGHETWSMYGNWMATKSAEWEWKKKNCEQGGERNVRKECERLQIKLLVTEQLAKNISSLSHSLCLSLFAQVAAKCCRPSA